MFAVSDCRLPTVYLTPRSRATARILASGYSPRKGATDARLGCHLAERLRSDPRTARAAGALGIAAGALGSGAGQRADRNAPIGWPAPPRRPAKGPSNNSGTVPIFAQRGTDRRSVGDYPLPKSGSYSSAAPKEEGVTAHHASLCVRLNQPGRGTDTGGCCSLASKGVRWSSFRTRFRPS